MLHLKSSIIAFMLAELFIGTSFAVNNDVLNPFPTPKKGEKRYVIFLPKLKNEYEHQVEIIAGRKMQLDCNYHVLGQIKQHSIKGWGYSYFRVYANPKKSISTLIGCPANSKRTAFVSMKPYKTSYNSRLPIVVYAPEPIKIKYRIWSANKQILTAKEQ